MKYRSAYRIVLWLVCMLSVGQGLAFHALFNNREAVQEAGSSFFLNGMSTGKGEEWVGVEVPLNIWADQQVYIVGELIWFDGLIEHQSQNFRNTVVRLVDRAGQERARVSVENRQQLFDGFIPIPRQLPSDYYFLDAYVPGLTTKVQPVPVMVINPRIPPVNCTEARRAVVESKNVAAVQTDKSIYGQREPVQVMIPAVGEALYQMVSAYRVDKLNELFVQDAAGFDFAWVHPSEEKLVAEGLSSRVRATRSGKPVIGIDLVAALKGGRGLIASARTGADGVATFVFPIWRGAGEMVYMVAPAKADGITLTLLSDMPNSGVIKYPCLQLSEYYRDDIEARIFNSSVGQAFYGVWPYVALTDMERDTSGFYGRPDFRYLLDEYVRFPNMQEVIEEIIPPVRVKKSSEKVILQVLNRNENTFFEQEGLILLDGVPVRNTRALIELDPLQIRSVDVIVKKYYVGGMEYAGLVHFHSYKGNLSERAMMSGDVSAPFSGVQQQAFLQQPEAGANANRLPDRRNVLVRERLTGGNAAMQLRFSSSDAVGIHHVLVRSVHKEGTARISAVKFEVKATGR